MPVFKCAIRMDSAAFEDNPSELAELTARITMSLRVNGTFPRETVIMDSNGNRVGSWKISPR